MAKVKSSSEETDEGAVGARLRDVGPYLVGVREELRKVTWPDRKETSLSTVVIVVLVLIVSV
jgi:preprotein translocase subunit SecE